MRGVVGCCSCSGLVGVPHGVVAGEGRQHLRLVDRGRGIRLEGMPVVEGTALEGTDPMDKQVAEW